MSASRQCGKTTLAKSLMQDFSSAVYFNWDDELKKNKILKRDWKVSDRLIIFDELHKFKRWKKRLKGLYDT